ncbi:MAG: hypothetical protein ACKOKG_13305, partial [Verrucomicrobiota bacterium]
MGIRRAAGSHLEQGIRPVLQAEVESALLDLHHRAVLPEAPTVERGEPEIGGGAALAADKYRGLRELLAGYGSCVVAYSGGVDSVFLAQVAHEV